MPRTADLESLYQHLSHPRSPGVVAGWRGLSPVGENASVSDSVRAPSSTPTAPPAPLTTASAHWFERAHRVTPGGVNSPVRAFNAVGRHPAVHGVRAGRVAARRRRQRVRRPDLLLGAAPAGPRPPRGPGRCRRGGVARHVVRHPDAERGRAGRGDRGAHAGRAGAPGLLRHRGHHVGDPAGPRLHRSRPGGEVRRLLPRPRRLPPGRGRLRPGHAPDRGCGPWHARCAGCLDRGHAGAALQRPRGGRGRVRRARCGDRLPGHRGLARQHGRGPAGAGLQPVPRRDLCPARRAVRVATR